MPDEEPTTAPPAQSPPPPPVGAPPAPYIQLTQSLVPLEDAAAAFSLPDASGRLPIVILPEQPFRIRNEFVIAGIVAVAIALIFDFDILVRGGLIAVGVAAIFLGVFQAFIVIIPEGSRGILLKGGKFLRSVGAGRHVLSPLIIVSRLVTVREIPFAAAAIGLPTLDDVRVDVELMLTFTIVSPEKFVFAISAPDFDQVCHAATLEAARELVRSKRADELLDLHLEDYAGLRTAIGEAIEPYGAAVQRVVVTQVRPPAEFMDSLESRRLLAVRREEQTERFALQQRLQTDRDAMERQRISARREQIDLEAANEALRLERMQERLAAYPAASRQDVLDRRIAVARELAGNTRAMVQVGSGRDVADALILGALGEESASSRQAAGPRRGARSAVSARDGAED
jgi:regulator of protease activity HflC (stomatin/prohibitin superfamily)